MKMASNMLYRTFIAKFEGIPPINFLVMTNYALFLFSYTVVTITHIAKTTAYIVNLANGLIKFSVRFIHYIIVFLI